MANIFEVKYSHISTVIYVGIKCRLNEYFVKILYCSCDISIDSVLLPTYSVICYMQ